MLQALSRGDGRFARRAGVRPTETELRAQAMSAILAEDTSARMEGDRPDLFSFDLRARAIGEAAELVAQYTHLPGANALEAARLAGRVAEERSRLARERALPWGAPTLLRGLAETWSEGASPEEAEAADARLAARLGAVDGSLAALTPELRDALESSLDPIEAKLSWSMRRSQGALVKLRVRLADAALSADRPAGAALTPEAENKLQTLCEDLGKVAGQSGGEAPALPLAGSACRLSGGGSVVGALIPPPERTVLCALIKALATGAPNAALLAAFHDRLVVALWATRMASGMPAVAAIGRPRPVAAMSPGLEAAWTREAALGGEAAQATATAIAWLFANGVREAPARARAWDALGDGPVDVAINALKIALP